MVVISTRSPHVHLTAWDVPGEPGPVLAAAQESAAALGRAPGFAGAVWLAKRADPVTPTPTPAGAGTHGQRVVEWFQWSSSPDQGAVEKAGLGGAAGPVPEHAGLYALRGVVTAPGVAGFELDPGSAGLTLMLLGESSDPEQSCALVLREADENIRFLPGFIGAAFLLAVGGSRMAEIIRWESRAAFQAATANPRFRARIESAAQFSVVDGGAYEISAVLPAPALG